MRPAMAPKRTETTSRPSALVAYCLADPKLALPYAAKSPAAFQAAIRILSSSSSELSRRVADRLKKVGDHEMRDELWDGTNTGEYQGDANSSPSWPATAAFSVSEEFNLSLYHNYLWKSNPVFSIEESIQRPPPAPLELLESSYKPHSTPRHSSVSVFYPAIARQIDRSSVPVEREDFGFVYEQVRSRALLFFDAYYRRQTVHAPENLVLREKGGFLLSVCESLWILAVASAREQLKERLDRLESAGDGAKQEEFIRGSRHCVPGRLFEEAFSDDSGVDACLASHSSQLTISDSAITIADTRLQPIVGVSLRPQGNSVSFPKQWAHASLGRPGVIPKFPTFEEMLQYVLSQPLNDRRIAGWLRLKGELKYIMTTDLARALWQWVGKRRCVVIGPEEGLHEYFTAKIRDDGEKDSGAQSRIQFLTYPFDIAKFENHSDTVSLKTEVADFRKKLTTDLNQHRPQCAIITALPDGFDPVSRELRAYGGLSTGLFTEYLILGPRSGSNFLTWGTTPLFAPRALKGSQAMNGWNYYDVPEISRLVLTADWFERKGRIDVVSLASCFKRMSRDGRQLLGGRVGLGHLIGHKEADLLEGEGNTEIVDV